MAKARGVVPAALASRPTLKKEDLPYQGAFLSLHSARTFGMSGPDPIRVTEVLAYLELVGIASPEHRAKYLRLIQTQDAVFLENHAEKAAKSQT